MKIGFIGNVANVMYTTAACFRQLGYDVAYYHVPAINALSHPAWEDGCYQVPATTLDDAAFLDLLSRDWRRPVWVVERHEPAHKGRLPLRLLRSSRLISVDLLLNPRALLELSEHTWPHFTAELRSCDWVLTRGITGLLACRQAGVPYVYMPHGQDVRDAAGARESIQHVEVARVVARAVRSALLCGSDQSNLMPILRSLAAAENVVTIPKVLDMSVYCPERGSRDLSFLDEPVRTLIARGERIVLFMPSRLSDRWKRTDMFMSAYAEAAKRFPKKFILVAVAWGEDLEKYRDMIRKDEDLSDSVFILGGMLSKAHVRTIMNVADVVVDQFKLGGYGNVFLQATACGKMVMVHLDRSSWADRMATPFPPVRDCFTAQDAYAVLEGLARGGIRQNEEGARLRKWVVRHHDMRTQIPPLVARIQSRLQSLN